MVHIELIRSQIGYACSLSPMHASGYYDKNKEPEFKKAKPKIPSCISPASTMDIDGMMRIISKAGHMVEKDLKEGCR